MAEKSMDSNKMYLMDNRRAQQELRPVTPDIVDLDGLGCVSFSNVLNIRESKLSDVKSFGTRVNYSQLHIGMNLQKALHANEIDFNNLFQTQLSTNDLRTIFDSAPHQLPLEWFDDFNIHEVLPQTWERLRKQSAQAFVPGVYDINKQSSVTFGSSLKFSTISFKDGSHKIGSRAKIDSNFWVDVQIIDYDSEFQRFKVIDAISFEEHFVPSIRINFWNEEPQVFVDRVKRAMRCRQISEDRIKYELMLDCVPVKDIPSLPEAIIRRIKVLVVGDKDKEMFVNNLMEELNLHFKRVQAEIQIKHNWRNNSEQSQDALVIEDDLYKNEPILIHLNYDYKNLRHLFGWNSIYCQPEVFNVVQYVSNSCTDVTNLCLFSIEKGTEITIESFDLQQKTKIDEITKFLQSEWPNTVSQHIFTKFKPIQIGWFDIRISNWEIYLISKMLRFMMLVRHKMQEAIQALIISSIQQYCDWLCMPCVSTLDVEDTYEWGEDVILSPFHSDFPVFHLVLHMNEQIGAHYSSNVDSFEEVLLRNYDSALLNTHFIKIIDPMVLKNLLYEPKLCLSSIGLMDERITVPRNNLERCYRKAVVSLKAYAVRYNEHLGFFAIDNSAYVQEFKEANKTMLEIKEEILLNIHMREQLEEKLPASIIIGPFFVLVHPLKRFLIKKRTDIIQKLLVMLNDKIRDKTMDIVLQYRDMYNRLFEPPPSVEYVFDTQKWMDTLPDLVKTTEEQMRLVLFDYDILDFFQYPLSNNDFALKWEGLRWPNKILQQINVTRETQIIDIEKFQKEQVSETSSFDKTIESLTVQVQEYQFKDDPSKALANAKQCKKLSEQLMTAQELGRTLNQRQLLFELPELELENIDQLIVSFKPYETLWYTAANFYGNRDNWMYEPLYGINVHDIFESIENSKNIFLELIDDFQELPRIQGVPNAFLEEIRNFEPVLDLMQDLTHSCWTSYHFKMLNDQSGMSISYSKELRTQMCVEEGILEHRDTVKHILKQAIEEHLQEERAKAIEAERRRKEEEILEGRRQRRLARTDI